MSQFDKWFNEKFRRPDSSEANLFVIGEIAKSGYMAGLQHAAELAMKRAKEMARVDEYGCSLEAERIAADIALLCADVVSPATAPPTKAPAK